VQGCSFTPGATGLSLWTCRGIIEEAGSTAPATDDATIGSPTVRPKAFLKVIRRQGWFAREASIGNGKLLQHDCYQISTLFGGLCGIRLGVWSSPSHSCFDLLRTAGSRDVCRSLSSNVSRPSTLGSAQDGRFYLSSNLQPQEIQEYLQITARSDAIIVREPWVETGTERKRR